MTREFGQLFGAPPSINRKPRMAALNRHIEGHYRLRQALQGEGADRLGRDASF